MRQYRRGPGAVQMAQGPQALRTDRSKKRSADKLDELAIEAARLLYEENLTAKEVSDRLRALGYEVRDQRDVRRLISRARNPDSPLIRVSVEREDESGADELQDLELLDLAVRVARVGGLRSALVVKSSPLHEDLHASEDARGRQRAYEASDQLHRRLGIVAGQYVWGRIRDGDCIAIGGGRAPSYMTEALERLVGPRWRLRRIRVVSLAARVGEQEWGTSRFVADADDLIGRLGKALAEHYDAQPVVVALAQGLEREAPDLVERKAPQLTGDTWEGHLAPDIAVFGAGVLSTGYPLLRSETTTFIKGIAGILKELDQHLQTGWQSAMLADVCNHYWVVGDPATPENIGLPPPRRRGSAAQSLTSVPAEGRTHRGQFSGMMDNTMESCRQRST